jgi:hypothetical protein
MMEVKIDKTGRPATGGKRHNRYQHKEAAVAHPKFEGRCDGLKGFMLDCTDVRKAD